MLLLSQRDPKWADTRLGKSKLTIGKFGCTITCIAMLSDYFGHDVTPDQIATKLARFTPEGLLIWQSLNLPTMKFEKRLYGQHPDAIAESLRDPNKAVILEVQGKHWVVALGKDVLGRMRIADPWFGDRSTMNRYKGQITGSAHFIQK